jgi:hypothetical protein
LFGFFGCALGFGGLFECGVFGYEIDHKRDGLLSILLLLLFCPFLHRHQQIISILYPLQEMLLLHIQLVLHLPQVGEIPEFIPFPLDYQERSLYKGKMVISLPFLWFSLRVEGES